MAWRQELGRLPWLALLFLRDFFLRPRLLMWFSDAVIAAGARTATIRAAMLAVVLQPTTGLVAALRPFCHVAATPPSAVAPPRE